MYSVNGTDFRAASQELRIIIKKLNKEKLEDFAHNNKFNWKFNPPIASCMGGAWKRLVLSIKSSLSVIFREQTIKEETLLMSLAEIEHSVNSHTLTHFSIDPRDGEALTPNHFLLRTSLGQIQIGKYDARNLCTRKQWKVAQFFADKYWR